ncbi:hypothetical protein D3C75_972370 [compost metagenome]
MKISTESWHYRLNKSAQGYSFVDRLKERRLTTCSYIRTTIRSIIQKLFVAFLIVVACGAGGIFTLNAFYAPLAMVFGWPVSPGNIVIAVVAWVWIVIIGVGVTLKYFEDDIRAKLSARRTKQLNLIEQRIKDGKDGICTIVEVV